MSETEKAMSLQPGLLALNWEDRITAKERAALKDVTRLTFIGTGTSFHCAAWATWLTRLHAGPKLAARAVTSWDFLAGGQAAELGKQDLAVIISHRGNRNLTKRLTSSLRGKKLILIAGEDAPTQPHPYLYTSPQEVSQAHTMSLVGAMAAVSELVAQLMPSAAAKKLRSERRATGLLLTELIGTDGFGASFGEIIQPGSALHIVGGGPLHAIAMELGLKAREIAHLAAHAYNTEEFLHGPVASVNEDDAVIVLPPLKAPTGTLARFLYMERLEKCRQAADAVGALIVEPSWDSEILKAAARVSMAWQGLPPLYWGQLLCLATAKRANINPDLNRRDDPRYEEARKRIEM